MKINDNKGFSLIELMVAVSIFGLIIGIVYTSFDSITKSSGIIKSEMENIEDLSSLITLLEKDLGSIFVLKPPEYVKPVSSSEKDNYSYLCETETVDNKEFSKLSFTSFNHIGLRGLKKRRISRISYFVKKDDSKGFVLMRRDNPDFLDTSSGDISAEPVCYGVESFKILSGSKEKEEEERWDSQSSEYSYFSPSLVTFEISVKNKGESLKLKFAILPGDCRDDL